MCKPGVVLLCVLGLWQEGARAGGGVGSMEKATWPWDPPQILMASGSLVNRQLGDWRSLLEASVESPWKAVLRWISDVC